MCFPPSGVLCTEVLAAHLFWQLGDECLQVEPGTYHPRVLLFRPVWAHAPCASFAVHRCGLGRELGRGVLHSSEKLRLMRRPCGVDSQQSPADDHSVTESCAAFVCAKSKGFQYVADRHVIASESQTLTSLLPSSTVWARRTHRSLQRMQGTSAARRLAGFMWIPDRRDASALVQTMSWQALQSQCC